jgi:hypothetical protein
VEYGRPSLDVGLAGAETQSHSGREGDVGGVSVDAFAGLSYAVVALGAGGWAKPRKAEMRSDRTAPLRCRAGRARRTPRKLVSASSFRVSTCLGPCVRHGVRVTDGWHGPDRTLR